MTRYRCMGLCALLLMAHGAGAAERSPATGDRPTSRSSTLSPALHPMNTVNWNQITTASLQTVQTRKARSQTDEPALSYPVEHGGKTIVVEQQFYPISHASPLILQSSLRKVLTKGIGRVDYLPDTAILRVLDRREIQERVARYVAAMDTAKPARMIVVAPPLYAATMKNVRGRLSPDAEIVEYPEEGVAIVRDDERRIGGIEMTGPASRPVGPRPPASRPIQPKRLPAKTAFPTAR